MTRWLSIVVVAATVVSASIVGCNTPTCGAGTKQVQGKNNELSCVPVDLPAAGIPCDVDGGATIVGGKCVSAVTCGQGTTLENGVCTSTGGGSDEPPPCTKPSETGNVCINGQIHNLVDGTLYTASTVTIAAYDPLSFLGGQPPQVSPITSSTGTYRFPSVQPGTGALIAIAVGDSDLTNSGGSGTKFVTAASGAQNVNGGGSYRVDVYVIPASVVAGWKSQTNTDWYATGGYLGLFFSDPKPDPTNLIANETHPVSGVQLFDSNAMKAVTGATYFSTSLATLDSTLTSTSAIGGSIAPPGTGANQITTYTGSGGNDQSGNPITWEAQLGGSTAHVIFVTRFHPN